VEIARLKAEDGITILPITVEEIINKEARKKISDAKMAPRKMLYGW
jgi:2-iminoacetate synthase ThiH